MPRDRSRPRRTSIRVARSGAGLSRCHHGLLPSVAARTSRSSRFRTSATRNFSESLVRTLANAKLASASNGRFRLDATLQLDQPFFAINTTVTASIAYRLTEVATGAVVYERTTGDARHREHTSTVHDGPRTYASMPTGGPCAANLRQLVQELYALPEPLTTSSRRTSAPRRSCNSAGRWAWARRGRRGRDGRRTWRNGPRCGS